MGAGTANPLGSTNPANEGVMEGCKEMGEVCWGPKDVVVCKDGDRCADVGETEADLIAFLFTKLGSALALCSRIAYI